MINKKIIYLLAFITLVTLVMVSLLGIQKGRNSSFSVGSYKYKLANECGELSGINRGSLATCVKEYLEREVSEVGFIETAKDLEGSVSEVPEINHVCHPYAHFIGKGAFKETKSVRKSIFSATSFCEWGYLHGLNIEAGSEYKGMDLYNLLIDGCLYLKELKGNYYECAHGMGDSFLNSTNNLHEALKFCEIIEDEGIRLNCAQGAANYWADAIVKKKKANLPLSKEEKEYLNNKPYKICEDIEEKFSRSGCFDYAVRLNQVYVGGVEKFIPLCKAYRDEDLISCFKGIGREMAYSQGFSIAKVVDICASSGEVWASAGCVDVMITSKTQIFRDIDGKVLKEVCKESNLSILGVKEGCEASRNGLEKYYKGDFKL